MSSLWKDGGRPLLPVGVWLAAFVLLVLGLNLPVVTLRSGLVHDTYSVLAGIADLAGSGEVLLALIVLGFSVLFPLLKLGVLARVLLGPLDPERRVRLVRALELLGRWSMLDVFVIAILIGAVQLGILSEARAERGVYVFGAGILGSMLATRSVQRTLARLAPAPCPRVPSSTRAERWGSLLTLGLFTFGLFQPLMVVQKLRFWDNEYSVVDASRRMLAEGELLLVAAVLFFVVLLPLARLLGIAVLRWSKDPRRLARPVLELEKWAMLDVFGLALLVVIAKIGAVASVETRSGFWILLAAAALSLRDSWALRRGSGA